MDLRSIKDGRGGGGGFAWMKRTKMASMKRGGMHSFGIFLWDVFGLKLKRGVGKGVGMRFECQPIHILN